MKSEKTYFLSLDLGTQGVKAALLDRQGRVIQCAFRENSFLEREEGEIAIAPEVLLSGVKESTLEVMNRSGISPEEIACVGVVGMMAGIVGIDADWNAVTPYDTGLDKRCEESIREMQEMGEERVIALCGCPIIVAMGAKMYWWKTNRPEDFSKAEKFLPVASYVSGAMAGLRASQAYIDYTHIHLTCFADVEKCQWSDELLSLFSFPKEKLPDILPPFKIIGSVTEDWAAETGLAAGIPVIAGCGDTAASSLGAGLVKKNMALDIAGTASCLAACVDTYRPDVEKKILLYPRSAIPGLWNPFGFVLGGQTLSWYFDQMNYNGEYTFSGLSGEAGRSEREDLYFVPFFAGRICPSNSSFSGSWIGMKFYHDRGDMFRSIMNSIGYEYKFYMDRILELFPEMKVTEIVTSAGGARSKELNQVKADILQTPLVVLKQKDTSHKASLILCRYGIGEITDMAEEALSICREEYGERILPREGSREPVRRRYDKYLSIVNHLEKIYADVAI